MTISIEWPNLRPINNSRQEGFEELVSQLARQEAPTDASYTRKGKPDAGLECYWTYSDGSEWGWQAKFFTTSPTSAQWRQIDDSVKRAIEKHPNLARMTIALPLDLPDARKKGQKSAQDKWNDHVKKWKGWAKDGDRSIDFDYWGSSELIDRLSADDQRGRVFFWFQQEAFTRQWFTDHITETIAFVGERYTPELDVSLPIAGVFDGLVRSDAFHERVEKWVPRLRKHIPSPHHAKKLGEEIVTSSETLQVLILDLCNALTKIDEGISKQIDTSVLEELIDGSLSQIREIEKLVNDFSDTIEIEEEKNQSSTPQHSRHFQSQRFVEGDLSNLRSTLYNLRSYLQSDEMEAANKGVLLLVGEAGKGKTHLLSDIAKKRDEDQLPTFFFLGAHFTEDIWADMGNILGLPGVRRREFLGALESAAQLCGHKALIIIDALNESSNPSLWRTMLAGFLEVVARYKWLSVAFSVRTTYKDMVLPDGFDYSRISRINHQGFVGVEYEAAKRFFAAYGISRPSVPILNPEFQTPLFLKLFCLGLRNQGLTSVPKGFRGITAIFDLFIESIFKRLQAPDRLNLSPYADVVQLAVDKMAALMAERKTHWLPAVEAEKSINIPNAEPGYSNSLFHHLLSEGLISIDAYRDPDDGMSERVTFVYQKLADHLITNHLLDQYLGDDLEAAFCEDKPLGEIVTKSDHSWEIQARGLIEAMSIQIPERTGRELIKLLPDSLDGWHTHAAFLESILWRDPNVITDETRECINLSVQREGLHERFLDILLTIAVDPVHPYNADFLHQHLAKENMPDRDGWWSVFLYEQYGTETTVDRVVDWAWDPSDRSHIEDESIRLCGVALSWFLTTSHRFLRDRSSKALVSLLTNRLDILSAILELFRDVNDLFVLERLLAVAYGCAMRSTDLEGIRVLAQQIFDWQFKDNRPTPHILLRDYARGVIEFAHAKNLKLTGEVDLIRPPYQSDWVEIPTEEYIESLKLPDGSWKSTDGSWSHNRIIRSVTMDDFAHYAIGDSLDWLSLKIDDPQWRSPEESREDFISSLSAEQLVSWKKLQSSIGGFQDRAKEMTDRLSTTIPDEDILATIQILGSNDEGKKNEINEKYPAALEFIDQISQQEHEFTQAVNQFEKVLDESKLAEFRSIILQPQNSSSTTKEPPRFSPADVQRWIIKKVFDLGWTIERFGWFDQFVVGSNPRSGYKPERIGKKYQWIAYHEILARIADNFQFREKYSHHKDKDQYRGTWQIHVRDIDPSIMRRSKPIHDDFSPSWWNPANYENWEAPEDDIEWLKQISDLPDMLRIIEANDPREDTKWLTLGGFYRWQEPTPADQDRYEMSRRDIFYIIQAYLVHKPDLEMIVDWSKKQDFYGRWMPEGREFHNIYLGELYWSPAYWYQNDPYMGELDWRSVNRDGGDEIPVALLPLTERHLSESGTYDCSVDEYFSITVPPLHLVDGMGLHWNGIEGNYHSSSDQQVIMDPSVFDAGPNALLIRREAFLEYLDTNSYSVVWTVLGEKNIIGGGANSNNWKGRQAISGVYRVKGSDIVGTCSNYYIAPNPPD